MIRRPARRSAPSTTSWSPSPAEAGEVSKTSPVHGGGGPEGWRGRWAGSAVAMFLAPTAAFAHPGDHTAMTVAQVAHHIVTSPDHLLEVVFAILMIAGEVYRRRRAAR